MALGRAWTQMMSWLGWNYWPLRSGCLVVGGMTSAPLPTSDFHVTFGSNMGIGLQQRPPSVLSPLLHVTVQATEIGMAIVVAWPLDTNMAPDLWIILIARDATAVSLDNHSHLSSQAFLVCESLRIRLCNVREGKSYLCLCPQGKPTITFPGFRKSELNSQSSKYP